MKISGIYKIINKNDGKYYVGSSVNLHKRWNEHIRLLNNNRHQNDYLQRAWNKYGNLSFDFLIIEEVSSESLELVEQKYLDIAKQEQDKSYNLNFNVCGREISEYSKNKIRTNKIEYWKDEQKRKVQSEKLKSIKSTPENKKKQSIRAINFYSNPKYRKQLSEMKIMFHSIPENKKRWKEMNSGLNNPQSDQAKYYFFNKKSKDREYCTRWELRTKYSSQNLSQSGVAQLCLGIFPSYKGWVIIP